MRWILKWLIRLTVVGVVLAALPAVILALDCDRELAGADTASTTPYEADVAGVLAGRDDYRRAEERTYLTFPEWFIVYVSQDYGSYLEGNRPSGFPYFSSVWDFWSSYCSVTRTTSSRYPTNWAAHSVIYVIGISHSAEYLVKGLYENTVGRLFELLSFGTRTEEERYAQKVAVDYGEFLNTTPWYDYPFGEKLRGLWQETELTGDGVARKWERKVVLTMEYAMKTAYGWVIRTATGSAYAPAPETIDMVVGPAAESAVLADERVEILEHFSGGRYLVRVPRYEAFSQIVAGLADREVPVIEIAGNDEILVTTLEREGARFAIPGASHLFCMTVATRPGRERRGYNVQVGELSKVIAGLRQSGGEFEHAYDY